MRASSLLGSHLPMSRKLHFAVLLGGLQSPIKWHNEREKEEKGTILTGECINYFGVSG